MKEVEIIIEIRDELSLREVLLVLIAAGKSLDELKKVGVANQASVRFMPNINA
ncbi:MAG: hypothetical protein LKF42_02055 [Streptococcaceae bacterium]|nr:hypothetical protein [Streptococcaceae bacterium]